MPKPGLLTLGGSPVSTAGLQAFGANRSGLDQLKTGSCVIHQKSSYGRTTYAQAVPVVSTIGYAYWPQILWGTNSEPVYVVLHREESGANVKWCLSLVNDAQLLATDIKLAVLITTKCVQLWQSDIYIPEIPDVPQDPPVVQPPVVEPDPNDPTTHVTVKSFMVNNLVPVIDDGAGNKNYLTGLPAPALQLNFDPNGYSYVYLRVGCDYSVTPHLYPVANVASALYPEVISSDIQLVSGDDYGYILIAVVKQATPNVNFSFVNSSLWSDRIKVANASATYYFSRV